MRLYGHIARNGKRMCDGRKPRRVGGSMPLLVCGKCAAALMHYANDRTYTYSVTYKREDGAA